MQQELNLKSEAHTKLVTNIIEKSLSGITGKEIHELRKVCNEDRYEYYNRIKSKYLPFLMPLGFNFFITEEVEEQIFFFIHDVINQISATEDGNSALDIQIS